MPAREYESVRTADNLFSRRRLRRILRTYSEGFFLIIAAVDMQEKIIQEARERNSDLKLVVHSYKLWDPDKKDNQYRFYGVEELINRNRNADAYILQNLQYAVRGDDDLARLNFSRDTLRSKKKKLLFCVTPDEYGRLGREAHDFISFIDLTVSFRNECAGKSAQFAANPGVRSARANLLRSAEKMTVSELYRTARQMRDAARFHDALVLLSRAANIARSDPNSLSVQIYTEMGAIFQLLKEYKPALARYETAFNLCAKLRDPKSARSFQIDIRNYIANAYMDMEMYENALEQFQAALTLCDDSFDLDAAEIYKNIAYLYEIQFRYHKAVESYYSAWSIFKRVSGPDSLRTIVAAVSLAEALRRAGGRTNLRKAIELYKQVYAATEKIDENSAPGSLNNINNNLLAEVSMALGNPQNALEFYQEDREIFEALFGKNDVITSKTYQKMADVYEKLRDYDTEAEMLAAGLPNWRPH